jgi:hypothetical protein
LSHSIGASPAVILSRSEEPALSEVERDLLLVKTRFETDNQWFPSLKQIVGEQEILRCGSE